MFTPRNLPSSLHTISLELTCASFDALRPPVINFSIAYTSAVFEPSTTRSATTDSAGFLERAALWAHPRIFYGWGNRYRADKLGG